MAKAMLVNGKRIEFDNEKNILEVVRKAGIEIPTFCYLSELSVYGACRMCLVEEEKKGIMTACSTPPRDGFNLKTNTEKIRKQRKITLELLLANHDRDCTTCDKNGDCKLSILAQDLGVKEIRFGERDDKEPIDTSSPAIIRDPNKCILCGDCVRMCEEIQGIGVIGFAYRGSKATVTPAFNKDLNEVDCVDCGQCAAVCPTGALIVKSEVDKVWEAINDPDTVVIAQVAPAVRVALGEEFGVEAGLGTEGKIVNSLKNVGFDYVFDTSFTADVTVVEEGKEFVERIKKGEQLPQFTSCCPAWVKYVELNHPELLDNLSSCKSPQQMFGTIGKKYYSDKLNLPTDKIFMVSVMPCTAKKAEAQREEFKDEKGNYDVNAVISTQEVAKMIKEAGVVFNELEEIPFDMPFGFATGSGLIFGKSGGVSEAVVKHVCPESKLELKDSEKSSEIKEGVISVGDRNIKLAVINGLKTAGEVIEKIKKGESEFDLIEVMACSGGCIGGAGQPYPNDTRHRNLRSKGLYDKGKLTQLSNSADNPSVKDLYSKWLKEPGSEESHESLHTKYHSRKRIQGEEISFTEGKEDLKDIQVCIGTCCYTNGSYDIYQELAKKISEQKLEENINLKATFCLENCAGSPSVKINNKIIGKVSKDSIESIINDIKGAKK